MGKSLSEDEAEWIALRCSMENLKRLEPDAGQSKLQRIPNSAFFHRGHIGNWRAEMSDEQSAQVDRFVEEKFKGSGVQFIFE